MLGRTVGRRPWPHVETRRFHSHDVDSGRSLYVCALGFAISDLEAAAEYFAQPPAQFRLCSLCYRSDLVDGHGGDVPGPPNLKTDGYLQ